MARENWLKTAASAEESGTNDKDVPEAEEEDTTTSQQKNDKSEGDDTHKNEAEDTYLIALLTQGEAVDQLMGFASKHLEAHEIVRGPPHISLQYIVHKGHKDAVTIESVFEVMEAMDIQEEVISVPVGKVSVHGSDSALAIMNVDDDKGILSRLVNALYNELERNGLIHGHEIENSYIVGWEDFHLTLAKTVPERKNLLKELFQKAPAYTAANGTMIKCESLALFDEFGVVQRVRTLGPSTGRG